MCLSSFPSVVIQTATNKREKEGKDQKTIRKERKGKEKREKYKIK